MTACTGFVTVAKDENLITNGDFELGVSGWTANGVTTSQLEVAVKDDGVGSERGKYVAFDDTTAVGVYRPGVRYYFKDELKAGTEYTLSFRYKASGGTTPVFFFMYCDDSPIQGSDSYQRAGVSSNWKVQTFDFTTPASYDASSSANYLQLYHNVTIEEGYYFMLDDVILLEKEKPLPIDEGDNLIRNSGFDKGIDNWTGYNMTLSAETHRVNDETNPYLCFNAETSLGEKTAGVRYDFSVGNDLKPETSYILSFRHATKTGANPVYVQFFNGSQIPVQWRVQHSSGDWEKVTYAFTMHDYTPENEDGGDNKLIIYYNRKNGISGEEYFLIDDIELRAADEYVSLAGDKNITETEKVGSPISLGTQKTAYAAASDVVRARLYSSTNKEVCMALGVYKKEDNVKQLMYFSLINVSAGMYSDNLYTCAFGPLSDALESGTYTAVVYAWDKDSGLRPEARPDQFTFDYTVPSTEA